MMNVNIIALLSMAVIFLCNIFVCGNTAGKQSSADRSITVFAAASLGDVLEPLAEEYELLSHVKVNIDFQSSGILRAKITAGARADVFLSASAHDMDLLQGMEFVDQRERRDILTNRLACIVPKDSALNIHSPDDLLNGKIRRIAIGDPDHVPAGIHAKEALIASGVWNPLYGKLIPCQDSRATLACIEMEAVDAAIVYQTDVSAGKNVKEAFIFPAEAHSPITYTAAILKHSGNRAAAEAFLNFLTSPIAARKFSESGFNPLFKVAE